MSDSADELILRLLRKLLTELVSKPQNLELTLRRYVGSSAILIRADAHDTGRIIGQGRETFAAIRDLVATMSDAQNTKVTLMEVQEPVKGERPKYRERWIYDPRWPVARIIDLVEETLKMSVERPREVVMETIEEDRDTVVEAYVSDRERLGTLTRLRQPMQVLFGAIAGSKGGKLTLNIVQTPVNKSG